MKETITLEELTTILCEMEASFTETSDLDKKVIKTFKQCMLEGYNEWKIDNIYVLTKCIMEVIDTYFDNDIVGTITKIVTVTFIKKAQNHGYFKGL